MRERSGRSQMMEGTRAGLGTQALPRHRLCIVLPPSDIFELIIGGMNYEGGPLD
jgi:hypothetical protein